MIHYLCLYNIDKGNTDRTDPPGWTAPSTERVEGEEELVPVVAAATAVLAEARRGGELGTRIAVVRP